MTVDKNLSDAEAKLQLARWPERPRQGGWFGGEHYAHNWVRAQPKLGDATAPRLFRLTGSSTRSGRTQPDGMWIYLHADDDELFSAAVFVIEVCTSVGNLHNKRTRYRTGHAPLHVEIPEAWLRETGNRSKRSRATLLGLDSDPATWPSKVPVVMTKVLYAVPGGMTDRAYQKIRDKYAWESHEAICPHKSLDHTRPETKDLVGRLLAPPWPVTQRAAS